MKEYLFTLYGPSPTIKEAKTHAAQGTYSIPVSERHSTMSEFEDVLMRNRDAIVEAQTTITLGHYPDRSRVEVSDYAGHVVDTLIAVMLTKISTHDQAFSVMLKRVLGNNLDIPEMTQRVERFVETVRSVVHNDRALTPEKLVHIDRMLVQSGRYLLMVVIPSLRSFNEGVSPTERD